MIDAAWRKDHNTAPLPLLRWLGALGVVIWYWAKTGTPHSSSVWLTAWLPALALVVVLALPDAASITFGGLRLEMRRTREDVAELRQQIMQMSIQAQSQTMLIDARALMNPAVQGVASAGAAADQSERNSALDVSLADIDRFLTPPSPAMDAKSQGDVVSGQ